MNLDKLTPAPWVVKPFGSQFLVTNDKEQVVIMVFSRRDDAEFAALARNALDIQMRRGWSCEKGCDGKWRACWQDNDGYGPAEPVCHVAAADPFTALVEAEKWLVDRK